MIWTALAALAGGGSQSTPGGGGDHLNMDGSIANGGAVSSGANAGGVMKLLGDKIDFYGGETCDQIRSACPIKIVESSKPIQSSDEKSFYTNVHIPRKKV